MGTLGRAGLEEFKDHNWDTDLEPDLHFNLDFSFSMGIAKHDLHCMQFMITACKIIKSMTIDQLPFSTAPKVL
jgi:hypothetical protein